MSTQHTVASRDKLTPWEVHLRDSFINDIKPEVSDMVKHNCVTCDCGNLETAERYAIHVEKVEDAWKKQHQVLL